MNIADWIFVVLIVLSAVIGILRGFWNQLFGLIALIASIGGTALLFNPLSSALSGIPDEIIRSVVAVCVPFVLILIIVYVVKGILWKFIKRVKVLKILDRVLGLVLGAAIIYVGFAVLIPFVETLQVNTETAPDFVQQTVDMLKKLFQESTLLNTLYSNNPIGNLIFGN
ncbi:MAG: CvpA family protein [Corallococcus sp.]|nr:CvpA family protein [Corallococcus sp.]